MLSWVLCLTIQRQTARCAELLACRKRVQGFQHEKGFVAQVPAPLLSEVCAKLKLEGALAAAAGKGIVHSSCVKTFI